jgi:HD-GYP domain-containing protein (c-di-GMP phosphodiesterase class II)
MISRELHANLFDLVPPLAKTADLMSPALANHHLEVAYLALRICEALDLPAEEVCDVIIGAALHDIGAFSLSSRMDLLEFEVRDTARHCIAGHLLLKDFAPFAGAARVIKHHHVSWANGNGKTQDGETVPRGSHIVHLADRVAILVPKNKEVLAKVACICGLLKDRCGAMFVPELVDAVLDFARRDHVWLEMRSEMVEVVLRNSVAPHLPKLDVDGLVDFSRLICRLIDFKSRFTATHTSGLVATAPKLARMLGFGEEECRLMEAAANLHDLGKLAVPAEILEKPGKLTDEEWSIMRSHVYHTYRILKFIGPFTNVTDWSALHQERLDGSGYPFGYTADQIPLGSRVMAVADVFTGITEDRPYREGMQKDEAQTVLRKMTEEKKLDEKVVHMLLEHFDELNTARAEAQAAAMRVYEEFSAALN